MIGNEWLIRKDVTTGFLSRISSMYRLFNIFIIYSLVGLIRIYQTFSPFLRMIFGSSLRCCFVPSCSEYMAQSVRDFGIINGFYRGLKRILSCHPFHFERWKKI